MLWWMFGDKGEGVDMKDTGLGAWIHLLLALGMAYVSYSIWVEERDSV